MSVTLRYVHNHSEHYRFDFFFEAVIKSHIKHIYNALFRNNFSTFFPLIQTPSLDVFSYYLPTMTSVPS